MPRRALPQWIAGRLDAQQQQVDAATLEFIADRVEGNLMAAHQEVQKLALLFPSGAISFEQVSAAVLDVGRSHRRITHNSPYRAGKGFVYEGGLRIPLLVRWPGQVLSSAVVDTPVVNTDWLPTFLDLAGLDIPSGLDGVSLAALLTGRGPAPQRSLYWHFPHYNNQGGRPSGAVREGDWMLIDYYDTEQTELYDLSTDRGEQRNLAATHQDRAARMRAALAGWRQTVGAQENRPNPNFDGAKYRALYVDVDASRFDPARADTAKWEAIWKVIGEG